ncbi:MAG TPA: AgmX/PglI C-terminal domain-containing protein [Polyangia bacterium]|nr:AgmX/PglI C-terminal domain-containing protein [Polyangia bacterium]
MTDPRGCRRHAAAVAECRACQRVLAAREALADAGQAEPRVDWSGLSHSLPWRQAHAPGRRLRVRMGWFVAGGLALAAGAGLLLWIARSGPRPLVVRAPPQPTPAPARDTLLAHATAVAGDVQVGVASFRALAPGSAVPEGAHITTENGRASLQWGERTGLTIVERSEIALAALDEHRSEVVVNRGEIALRVGSQRADQSFRVATPGHSIDVRGTWFRVTREAGRTLVVVCEGQVVVSAHGLGGERVLERGQAASFRDGSIEAVPAHAAAHCPEPWLLKWPDNIGAALLKLVGAHAEISVDLIPLGVTPASLQVGAGRHRLDIVRAGVHETQWLKVAPGEQLIKVKELDLSGRAAEIGARVPSHNDEVRACYERGLKRDPSLAGRPKLRLKVGSDGHVQRADIVESDLGDVDVETCITSAAQRWVFPAGPPVTFDSVLDLRGRK